MAAVLRGHSYPEVNKDGGFPDGNPGLIWGENRRFLWSSKGIVDGRADEQENVQN